MGRQLTTGEFIAKAKTVHGDKYDYSKVEYINAHTKVCIICSIHGDFWQTPNTHLRGRGCPLCGVVSTHSKQRKSREDFIASAIALYGAKYDYSLTDYKSAVDKVCIICPTHGEFWQTPDAHLHNHGCPKCAYDSRKKYVYGVGINDSEYPVNKGKAYKLWVDMLARCFSVEFKLKRPTYIECTCCNDWLYYSNFKKWFDAQLYKDGYHLDKDIIVPRNKVYSPDTCALVPPYINSLLVYKSKKSGDLMRGVSKEKESSIFRASCCINKRNRHLGSFKDELEAHEAYKKAKYEEIRRVATNAFNDGDIDERVYKALLNYKINKY